MEKIYKNKKVHITRMGGIHSSRMDLGIEKMPKPMGGKLMNGIECGKF